LPINEANGCSWKDKAYLPPLNRLRKERKFNETREAYVITLEEDECKTKAWSNLGLLYTVKNNNDKMMNKGVKRTIGYMLTRIG
jgi:hypothetical protein